MCMRINYQPVTEPAIMDGFGLSLYLVGGFSFSLSPSLSGQGVWCHEIENPVACFSANCN